ncbi:hypothetical protein A4X06_0g9142 [Tilletia controversa]|uniref:Uncharacterized protein n=1 Tax=Tilletia controversa TaxID=13291 RepID=A0A8X7MIT5_9BASI|nr:hypothetical protein A4X06_0g9142 [Tilletia controversa]
MGYDLADAYQQVPNLPAQRRRFVFGVAGQLFVWVVGMFGIATMSAIFGQLCDVSCAWLEHQLPSLRARHFADDHMVLHDAELGQPPPPEADVYAAVNCFGWKVHATKRFGWTRRFTLLGFEWDLDAGTVALTEEKREKYLRKLSAFLQPKQVNYRQTSSVLGTLVHTCAIFSERRSHLNALYALRSRFDRSFPWHSLALSTAAHAEVREWLGFLQTPSLARSFHIPTTSYEHTLYSDASDLGCGVVLDGRACFWPLPGAIDNDDVDIGVMEAWALHLALQACVAAGAKECVVQFAVDNMGVVYAVRKGRSRSRWTNRCLASIAELASGRNITMSVSYIASADNPADAPSRGDCSLFAPLEFDWAAPWQGVLGAALHP